MDMNRRTALKSLLALALAPTVSLRRGVDREALLAAFCDNDSCSGASVRFDIRTPFRYGSQTVATDGFRLARAEIAAPLLDGGSRRIPPVDSAFKMFWRPGDFRPLQLPPIGSRALYRPFSEPGACPECGCRRVSYGPYYPTDEQYRDERLELYEWDVDDNTIRDKSCPCCCGLAYKSGTLIRIGDAFYDYWLMRPVAALPNVRVAVAQHEKRPLCFVADGFDGMVMGVDPLGVDLLSAK